MHSFNEVPRNDVVIEPALQCINECTGLSPEMLIEARFRTIHAALKRVAFWKHPRRAQFYDASADIDLWRMSMGLDFDRAGGDRFVRLRGSGRARVQ